MFPRQHLLNPVLDDLRKIKGVKQVQQDDFDSQSIIVFVTLDDANSRAFSINGHKPGRFTAPLRAVSAAINTTFRRAGMNFKILNRPRMTYYESLGHKVRDGYDTDSYQIEAFC